MSSDPNDYPGSQAVTLANASSDPFVPASAPSQQRLDRWDCVSVHNPTLRRP